MPSTAALRLARTMLDHDDFIDGHVGIDAAELGETAPSEPGIVSVHLNGAVAEALLAARGWKLGHRGQWLAPDAPDRHWVWGRDEALRLALTAEVVA